MTTQTSSSNKPQKVVALSGSLKKSSWNQMLATQAAGIAEELGADVVIVSLNDYPLPLFNEDIESEDNAAVNDLRAIISGADALIIASPEYNGSLTPALKNAIDWISRPNSDRDYQPRYSAQKAAIVSTSPGGLGGIRGLNHLREILTNLGTLVVPSQLAVPVSYEAFNDSGELVNAATVDRLKSIVSQLLNTTTN